MIISITPSVAHKNTNRSTPIRRIHMRIDEGAGRETESGKDMPGANVSVGGFRFPTSSESVANGSLGSEIIARKIIERVVVSTDVGLARDRDASRKIRNPQC